MARVTVDDCLENVDNRFHLVMLASKRARQLATTGADPLVEWGTDKPTVVALREIAEGHTEFAEPEELLEEELQIDTSLFNTGPTTTLFGVPGTNGDMSTDN